MGEGAVLDRVLPGMRPRLLLLGKDARAPLLTSLAYLIGAEAAFLVGTLSDTIFAPFWPPNVVLFCALLLAPAHRWWIYLLAAAPAHILAELQVAMPAAEIAVAFATNCLVAVLNAVLVRRVLKAPPWLGTLKRASLYVLLTAFVGPAISALGGAFVPILGGGAIASYPSFWAQWYLSNALGFLTLGPIVLIWIGADRTPLSPLSMPRLAEASMLGIALVIVCALAFQFGAGMIDSGFMPAILYSPLPLILACAIRFGERGASGAVLVVTIVLLWLALNHASMFITPSPERNVLALQIFLVGLSIPVLLLGAAIDEVRRAEQATRESEQGMQLAAASANIGLWYFDQASGRFWATGHCRSLLGIAPHTPLTPALIQQVAHPEDRHAAVETMRSATDAGQEVVNEFRVVLPEGGLRWLRARARAHREEGQALRVTGVFMDITAAKQAELEADLQRREVAHLMRVSVMGELSGAIAHELNQPLTAILSNAQASRLMLAGKPPHLSTIGDAIDDIVHESKRAGDVIGRLHGLLKKGDRKLELVDLNELIRSTIGLLHSELVGRRFRADLDLAEKLPPIAGDAVQLQQVLLNLVMNAMDAMAETPPARRSITVSTRLRGKDGVETVVADHGQGLAPAEQARAFEPFFTTKPHGLGLGLAICSTIVGLHGGQLALANNPGGGARATLTLQGRRNPVIVT